MDIRGQMPKNANIICEGSLTLFIVKRATGQSKVLGTPRTATVFP